MGFVTRPEKDAANGNCDNGSDSSGSAIFAPSAYRRTESGRIRRIRKSHSQSAILRSNNEETAMSQRDRVTIQLRNFFKRFSSRKSCLNHVSGVTDVADVEKGKAHSSGASTPQYRLETVGRTKGFFSCVKRAVGDKALSDIKPNEHLASFLHWTFRSNFVILVIVMFLCFFGLIVCFSALIFAGTELNSDCVRAGGEPASRFLDSFTLSWTTFSTVGYGSTYPALSHENDQETSCIFITFICSMESFFGVLYSGLCGAILFGKVLRIQSHAQVIFSDAIVIRYGSGLQEGTSNDDSDSDNEFASERKKIPCPVLEFRIVNRLFDEPGGEIMDASLNVVANINARDADPVLVDALNSSRRSKLLRSYTYKSEDFYGSNRPSQFNRSDSLLSSDNTSVNSGRFSLDSQRGPMDSQRGPKKNSLFAIISRNHRTIDEDPSSRLVDKRIFSKMYFEQCEHPFFKRVWVGRHILNGESPLVRPKVKRRIRRNHGYWPEELNDYASVRGSLLFNQILVSLNGVSNLSAHEVYAQKIYDFVDMNVGYQFVNTLYKDDDGTLKVDTDLINDVREQHGGGGEPLILENEEDMYY